MNELLLKVHLEEAKILIKALKDTRLFYRAGTDANSTINRWLAELKDYTSGRLAGPYEG